MDDDPMSVAGNHELDEVVRAALAVGDVASAAVFVLAPGAELELAAASGIEGPALEALVRAARSPAHPIARTLSDDGPTFDVLPSNPGGPRLRSHLPLRVAGEAVGVLAVAHESVTTDAQRDELIALAMRASTAC